MSSINVDPDLAVEIFVLEPADDSEPAPSKPFAAGLSSEDEQA